MHPGPGSSRILELSARPFGSNLNACRADFQELSLVRSFRGGEEANMMPAADPITCSRTARLKLVVTSGFLVLVLATLAAQLPPLPPDVTAEEGKTYQTFFSWYMGQPREVQREPDDGVFRRYAATLEAAGQSRDAAAATIALLQRVGQRIEAERWNRILTAEKPVFNTAPNAFLVDMTKGLAPGRSLDVGMGQGRNTIYLAQQGWDSVGFDPADRAIAAAQERAKALGVKITTTVVGEEAFDWGESRWDLIVLSYVGARDFATKVQRALRPGGMVVVEAFHRDATKSGPIGPAVVFETNELLQLFSGLRIVRYEDTEAVADFGLGKVRVVRLAAVKP
jgi:SAM-dependent methyltransferase